jgi:PAS domain S-box-containing protein
MDFFNIIASCFISIGAAIMAYNIFKFKTVSGTLKHISPEGYKNLSLFLNVHRYLIAAFFSGYLFVLYAINSTNFSMGNLFSGFIFLCGAIFVLLGIILQGRMLSTIGGIYQQSLEINRQLIENQKALTRNRDHTRNILNSLSSAIIGLDDRGNCTQFNAAAEQLSGFSFSDALQRHYAELFPALKPFDSYIKTAMQGEIIRPDRRLKFGVNESEKIFSICFYPLKTREKSGVVIRLDDITEKTLLEKQIIQSEKMMSIGGLAAGMAHEINNPLAGMMQNAQLATARLSGNIPANDTVARQLGTSMSTIKAFIQKRGVFEQLERINEAGIRAAKIIDNMLSFSRKGDPIKNLCKITDLIDDCLTLAESDYDLKKNYDFKHIRIIRNYDTDLPQVMCEKNKIQQVLFNIIKNAAQAMSALPDPKKQPLLTVNVTHDPKWLIIEIMDNGPGMDPQTREKAFEPFFTTKPVGTGTGLGLSVSYFIIANEHDGRIELESEVNKGTCFRIQLPLKPV